LRELISDRRFESTNCHLFRKQIFLYRDAIYENKEVFFDVHYKWLHQIGERHFFLPNMEQIFLLLYLQSISIHRYMNWHLVKASGVAIRRISNRVAFPVGHSREILELFSFSIKQEFPTGKSPKQAGTFISRFMEVKGDFPQSDFRVPGWVHSTKTSWWPKMVASSSRNWRSHCSSASYITPSGPCVTGSLQVIINSS